MALTGEPVTHGPEDLTRDGSLLKTLLVEGAGETVTRGAKVAVRYSLRLSEDDSTEPFDSSAKRRDGVLEFTLGRHKVIPALELVAHSMKVGEKCKARAAAPYAFGPRGIKRKGVPPDAVVFLEVEMVRCEGGEKKKPLADMSPNERFEAAKTSKEVGNNFFKEQKYEKALAQYSQSITYLSSVFYKPSPTLADPVATPIGDKRTEGKGKSDEAPHDTENDEGFQEAEVVEEVSNGQIAPEVPAATRVEGDTIQLQSPVVKTEGVALPQNESSSGQEDQAATEDGAVADEADTAVVETIDVSTAATATAKPEVESDAKTSPQEGVSNAIPTGEETSPGDGDQSATKDEEGVPESEDPEESEVRSLHVTTLNNLSLCFVKLEDYKRAVDSATLALNIDSGSSKALYYRGRAKIALGEWDDARIDLEAAFKIQPKNPGIRNELIKLDKKVKLFEEREKKRAAAMFA